MACGREQEAITWTKVDKGHRRIIGVLRNEFKAFIRSSKI